MPEAALAPLRGRAHPSGAGIRDHVLVIPSVVCAAQASLVMAEGVGGAVAIEHQHGCAQLGGDAHLTAQVLVGLGTHPNVAGALVVSLGCETVQGVGLHRAIVGRGQRAEFVGIQQAGGTGAAIRAGREALGRLRDAAASDPEVAFGWADLRVGIEAAWLGLPPAQARIMSLAVDRLCRAGATVIQAAPAGDGGAGVWWGRETRPPAPLGYATRPAGSGLFLMEAPPSRIAQKTGLAAAGAHVILSPLAQGLPAGCPVAPVVHVGIAPYARAFAGDVDVMLDQDPPPETVGAILEAIAAACREETALEALGAFEMGIHRLSPTM